MSTPTFNVLIERILDHEGGYVNHPNDPGGETKFGISKRSYPYIDIKNLTRGAAIDIYERDFWNVIHGDNMPLPIAWQALDAAVNHGIGNSIRWVQRAVGVADDGAPGPVTWAAIRRTLPNDLLLLFNAERLEFYAKLEKGDSFWRGWIRRVAKNLRYAAKDEPT